MASLIVSFVTSRYVPLARNWLTGVHRTRAEGEVIIVTTDLASQLALSKADCRTLHRPVPLDAHFWTRRLQVLIELLVQGHDIIHSDLDAVWLRDPLPAIRSAAADMTFTQGTTLPTESFHRRGFVLCCGFFHLRYSRQVEQFAFRWLDRTREVDDDQVALNRLVDDEFESWSIDTPESLPFGSECITWSRTPMTGRSRDLTLGVLPHHAFPRLMTGAEAVCVGHPWSGGVEAARAQHALRDAGLWLLD